MLRSYTHRIAVKRAELEARRRSYLWSRGFRKTDDQLTYTERGWPRPVSDKYGLRIPWVSPAEQLNRTHPDRMAEVVEYALCQVCGEGFRLPSDNVFVLVNGEISEHPDEVDLSTKVVQAMDNATMHWRCMRLATGQCPMLRKLRADDNLYVFRTNHGSIKIYDNSNDTDPDADKFVLGVDGEFVTYVKWEDIHGRG